MGTAPVKPSCCCFRKNSAGQNVTGNSMGSSGWGTQPHKNPYVWGRDRRRLLPDLLSEEVLQHDAAIPLKQTRRKLSSNAQVDSNHLPIAVGALYGAVCLAGCLSRTEKCRKR